MKKAYLTFDYEMFLGLDSGTVQKCQIEPTALLLKYARDLSIPLTFFVDMNQIWRMQEEPREQANLNLLLSQIRQMANEGHRVELHLHPHWLDAEYLGEGHWQFKDLSKYRLQGLDHEQIVEMLCRGAEDLKQILAQIVPNYQVQAFRAGGWCIQPFAPSIREGFQNARILIDSSVAPGVYAQGEAHSFDFRLYPSAENCWRFDLDPLVPETDGPFLEIPITTFSKSWMHFCVEKVERLLTGHAPAFGDGRGLAFPSQFGRFDSRMIQLTLEVQSVYLSMLWAVMHPAGKLVYISHPKGMSEKSFHLMKTMKRAGFAFGLLDDFLRNGQ